VGPVCAAKDAKQHRVTGLVGIAGWARGGYAFGVAYWFSPNTRRSAEGSLLRGWLDRFQPHPDSFVCGILRPQGAGSTGGGRWEYRRVWVDQLVSDGVVTMQFSKDDRLRVRLDADPWWKGEGRAPRSGLEVLSARSADSGEHVLLAVPPGELIRFGLQVL